MNFNNALSLVKDVLTKKNIKSVTELFEMNNELAINNLSGIIFNGVIFNSLAKESFQIVSEYWTFKDGKFEEVIAYDIYDDTRKNIIKVEHKKMVGKINNNEIEIIYKPSRIIPSTLIITNNEIKLTIEDEI